ncbi:MAG: hypothetical protein CVU03_03530 [Bacteroidetes bacterium HGW-Bacteroidetes-2]|nr:MAG: hypothetical protein CVU03_03530 [Bacteroidetes bacterium HGW-Bacteroidetes-2]
MDLLKILEKTDYKLSLQNFWQLVNYGREIKSLYFIEKKTLEQNANYFPVFRNPIVTQIKVIHRGTKKATGVDVCINKMQFYKNVSEEGWAFCLDSYSPAQRWLENKTGKNVTTMDVAIFKKNISFSTEMSRLTKKINAITI